MGRRELSGVSEGGGGVESRTNRAWRSGKSLHGDDDPIRIPSTRQGLWFGY